MFVDANTPTVRKKIKKLSKQEPYESRIVWRDLTEAMARGDSETAAEAKYTVSMYIVYTSIVEIVCMVSLTAVQNRCIYVCVYVLYV